VPRRTSILVSAGEVSGDRIAAPVVRELLRRHASWCFFGAGGESLVAAGVEVRHASSRLAAVGLTEAVPRAASAVRLIFDLCLQACIRRPRLALLVDCPGINLRLAALLRAAGTPVLYYVAPQRWAWLEGRTAALRRAIDRLAVTLPFEESWFAARGVPATYVGHPLIDLFRPTGRDSARAALGLGPGHVLALLPGSRSDEIRRHLPLLLRALAWLPPEVQPVIAAAPGAGAALYDGLAPAVARGTTEAVLGAADAALCASGTATLEAAIAGVPTAVFYRLSPLSHAVARRLVRVPSVALPNLILGQAALRELIQDEMTPAALAFEARRLLDPSEAARQRAVLEQVVVRLGRPGAAARVADMAEEMIGE
jgi:lipid-A-disaccharide synthase